MTESNTIFISDNNLNILRDENSFLTKQRVELFDLLNSSQRGIEITFVRHAQSTANLEPNIIGGRSSWATLSADGLQQAKLIANRFRTEGQIFDKILSSTSTRAIQTCEEIAKAIGFDLVKIIRDDQFSELSHGDWEGKSRDLYRTSEVLERMKKEHWEFKSPNGESQKEVEQRMWKGIDKHFKDYIYDKPNQLSKFLIVGHGLAIKCFFRRLFNLNPKLTYKLNIENTGICKIVYDGELRHLHSFNDFKHLQNYETNKK